jgi:hypothetical protein
VASQVRVCHCTRFELLHCVSRDSFQSAPNWSLLSAHFPACTWRFISSYTELEPSVGNHAPTVFRSLKVLLPRYSQEPGTRKSQSPTSKSANATSRTSTTCLATERGGVMGWWKSPNLIRSREGEWKDKPSPSRTPHCGPSTSG